MKFLNFARVVVLRYGFVPTLGGEIAELLDIVSGVGTKGPILLLGPSAVIRECGRTNCGTPTDEIARHLLREHGVHGGEYGPDRCDVRRIGGDVGTGVPERRNAVRKRDDDHVSGLRRADVAVLGSEAIVLVAIVTYGDAVRVRAEIVAVGARSVGQPDLNGAGRSVDRHREAVCPGRAPSLRGDNRAASRRAQC